MPRLEPYYALAPENFWLADRLPIQPGPSVLDAFAISADAEFVRQWVLRELVERYHFPGEWLGHRLVLSTQIEFETFGFIGLSLLTSEGTPFLYVSVQPPGNGDKAQEALRAILLAQEFAGAGISTDGSGNGTKIIKRRFDSHQCDYMADIGVYRLPLASPKLLLNGTRKDARHLKTLSRRFESIFFEIQSQLRDIDGMHADEALDELCKVLCLKLFDEEKTPAEQPYTFQRGLYGSLEELVASIRKLHQRAMRDDALLPTTNIPAYQRTRGVFDTRLRLSSPALLKCVEALQSYDIGRSQSDIKGRAFQQVLAPTIRSGMGQYFTPQVVVKFMVEVTDPKIADRILDPFSGSGQFLSASREWVRLNGQGHSENELHKFTADHLHGIEKSDRMVRLAMTDMRLHGDDADHTGQHNLRCTDALLDFSNYSDLQPASFDLILTNPPFGSLLGEEAISQLGDFCLSQGRKRVPLEVLGLERCMQFLHPGGRMGIVLPDGLLANRKLGYVREWLDNNFKVRAIISLPIETFAPFGANIQTSILFARKWQASENRAMDYTVFLARVDNIGYDSAERTRGGAEFSEVALRLKSFLQREGW